MSKQLEKIKVILHAMELLAYCANADELKSANLTAHLGNKDCVPDLQCSGVLYEI